MIGIYSEQDFVIDAYDVACKTCQTTLAHGLAENDTALVVKEDHAAAFEDHTIIVIPIPRMFNLPRNIRFHGGGV